MEAALVRVLQGAEPPVLEPEALEIPAHKREAAVILFLVVCLIVGIFTKVALARVPIPFTALLLIWGLIIGFMEAKQVGWTYLSWGITYMRGLAPAMVLQIFLPVIGFTSGFYFDPHLIRKQLVQVFLLAWPGVLVGALMIGAIAYGTFGYGWTWVQAFLFGAMLSVTDPVAVIALLKEVGASAKLGIVIEGESLVNDGSGFVLFTIFRVMVEGGAADPLGVFKLFLQLAIGGLAIGFAYGCVASYLLGLMHDAIAEIMLTVLTSYITYYTANDLCGTSGLLAVVAVGMTMSIFGQPRVTPASREPMKVFWEMAEWMVNTILFIYVGIIMGIIIVGEGQDNRGDAVIQPRDWGIAAWLYVILQFTRVAMIVMFWPLMLLNGYPPTWKDVTVMSWAGLRGIVGLVIGLVIYQDKNIKDLRLKTLCLFHVGIMAVVTIILNGATTGPLLKLLGMTSNGPAKLLMLQKVYQDMEKLGSEHVRDMDDEDPLGLPDLQAVMKQTRLDLQPVFKQALRSAIAVQTGERTKEFWGRTTPYQISAKAAELLIDIRTRFLTAAKASFGEGFEKGYISHHEIQDLREAIDVALDKITQPMCAWAHLRNHGCQTTRWMRLLGRYQTLPVLGKVVQRVLFGGLSSHATMAGAFVYAYKEAQKMTQDYLLHSDEVHDDTTAAHLMAAHEVLQESAKELAEALAFISGLSVAFPLVPRAVKTRQVSTTILRREAGYLSHLFDSGLLDFKEFSELSTLLESRMKALDISTFATDLPTAKDSLPTHPLFASLTLDEISKHVWRNVAADVVAAGDVLCKKGAPLAYVYVVLRGYVTSDSRANTPTIAAVRAASPPSFANPWTAAQPAGPGDALAEGREPSQDSALDLGSAPDPQPVLTKQISAGPRLPLPDEVVGLVELLTEQEVFDASVVASSPLQLLRIPASTFLVMMEELPPLRQAAWIYVATRVFAAHGPSSFRNKWMEDIEDLFGDCALQVAKPHDAVEVAVESYLVHGTVYRFGDGDGVRQSHLGPAVLPSGGGAWLAKTVAVVFHRRPSMQAQRAKSAASLPGQADVGGWEVASSKGSKDNLIKHHQGPALDGTFLDTTPGGDTGRMRSTSQYSQRRVRRHSAASTSSGQAFPPEHEAAEKPWETDVAGFLRSRKVLPLVSE